jgi:ubiquinone/menaquinone biosynthesis C-methylase UbiE
MQESVRNPRETLSEVGKSLYGKVREDWENVPLIHVGWFFKEKLEILEELGFSFDGKKVLDLGSGKGRFASRMKDVGATVIQLDLKHEKNNENRVIARAEYLPFTDNSFDFVWAAHFFDKKVYNYNEELVLSELRRVLRDGGMLICISHSPSVAVLQKCGFSLQREIIPEKGYVDTYSILHKG